MRTAKGTEVTIGCDPEFFLFNPKLKRNLSAHRLIPGDKANPHKVDGGAIQVDGTAVEFNIDPSRTPKEFEGNINKVLSYLRKNIPEKYEFQFSPAVFYPQKYFDKLPKRVKELGCDPDFNAYNGSVNPKPPADEVGTMRTGSGHIHIGWTKDASIEDPSHLWDCQQLVMGLDSVFKVYSHFWDNDTDRRKLYGNEGAFRPKSYGVEYRVLSNAWLNHPELYQWLFSTCFKVFESLENGYAPHGYNFRDGSLLRAYTKSYDNRHISPSRFISWCGLNAVREPRIPDVKGWTPEFSYKILDGLKDEVRPAPQPVNWIA